jgi:hypothetical protein
MFPKTGNYFPNGGSRGRAGVSYPAAIAAALNFELGNSHRAVKTVMRWTGANERTVKNWFAGKRGPRGEHLIGLIRHSNGVLESVLRLAGREQIVGAKLVLDARTILVNMLALADEAIAGRENSPTDGGIGGPGSNGKGR